MPNWRSRGSASFREAGAIMVNVMWNRLYALLKLNASPASTCSRGSAVVRLAAAGVGWPGTRCAGSGRHGGVFVGEKERRDVLCEEREATKEANGRQSAWRTKYYADAHAPPARRRPSPSRSTTKRGRRRGRVVVGGGGCGG